MHAIALGSRKKSPFSECLLKPPRNPCLPYIAYAERCKNLRQQEEIVLKELTRRKHRPAHREAQRLAIIEASSKRDKGWIYLVVRSGTDSPIDQIIGNKPESGFNPCEASG